MLNNFIRNIAVLTLLFLFACSNENQAETDSLNEPEIIDTVVSQQPNQIEVYYSSKKGNSSGSKSLGRVSKGSLENGKLVPFEGKNFQYFDTSSYLGGRAFTNDRVLKTMLATYQVFDSILPKRKFYVMECSNEKGGKIFPHRTHQNGLSVDFMMPLIKNNKPFYDLADLGASHYWLTFDNEGKYEKDSTVSIDFELVARHILELSKQAKKNNLSVKKVIIKVELKDELFSGFYGKQLKKSGIYVVNQLSPLINSLHDDHYHVDFALE